MKARAEGKKLHTNTEIKCKPCFSTSALHTRTSNHTRLLVPTRANNSHTEMLGGIHPACNVQCEQLQRYWTEVGKRERWFYKANSKLRFKVWKKKTKAHHLTLREDSRRQPAGGDAERQRGQLEMLGLTTTTPSWPLAPQGTAVCVCCRRLSWHPDTCSTRRGDFYPTTSVNSAPNTLHLRNLTMLRSPSSLLAWCPRRAPPPAGWALQR